MAKNWNFKASVILKDIALICEIYKNNPKII